MAAHNAINLQGQQFSFWKVLNRDEERTKATHNAYWNCECLLCHQIYSVRGTQLRNGGSTKCPECAGKEKRKNELNNVYGALKVIEQASPKNNRMMWLCECSCGNHIIVSGTDLRTHKVQSCGKCPERRSLGEKEISQLLTQNNIIYKIEQTFEDFTYKNGHKPRFDFYLPDYNCIIEYDGKQHFSYQTNETTWNNKKNYELTVERDMAKNNYCFSKNIILIRIPYYLQSKITIQDLLPETSKYIIKKGD